KRRDALGGRLVARGAQAHRLRLVLVVADGVEHEAETARVEPTQERQGDGGEREAQVVEERLAAADLAGKERGHHAPAAADELPAAGELARGDPEAERPDGEVVSAQAEDAGTEQRGERGREKSAGATPEKQPGEIAESGVALGDHAGVHPHAEEEDVAEGVVAHLAAEQVPGEREDDHHPEQRQLAAVGRREHRGEQRKRHHGGDGHVAEERRLHLRYLRSRASQKRRQTRMATRSAKTKAAWYSAPRMNPAKFSATPSPS